MKESSYPLATPSASKYQKMKRFLLLALTAGLISPTAANAEPIPKISDFDSTFIKPIRIDFSCPKEVTREMEDGRMKKVKKKLYKSCWVDFHKGYLNIMDRQTIKREDVVWYWWGVIDNKGAWNLIYRTNKDERRTLRINQDASMFDNSGPNRFKKTNIVINEWMAQ